VSPIVDALLPQPRWRRYGGDSEGDASVYCDIRLFCSTFTRLSVQKVQFAP